MIIPAIDLERGRVVQLVQGERKALERDLDEMLAEFRGFPVLQIIDLAAAKGEGDNCELVRRCCQAGYSVRVGGGIRSLQRAEEVLSWGADHIIVGSAAFTATSPNVAFLDRLLTLGRERIIIAVDSRGDFITIKGWRETLPLRTVEVLGALESYCSEFLYTQVETEGLMRGIPLEQVRRVRNITRNRLTVAGGIASIEEIEALEAMGCNSVLGMALYIGKLPIDRLRHLANVALLDRSKESGT